MYSRSDAISANRYTGRLFWGTATRALPPPSSISPVVGTCLASGVSQSMHTLEPSRTLFVVLDVPEVARFSPAEVAGVHVGDLVTQAAGEPVTSDDFFSVVERAPLPFALSLSRERSSEVGSIRSLIAAQRDAMALVDVGLAESCPEHNEELPITCDSRQGRDYQENGAVQSRPVWLKQVVVNLHIGKTRYNRKQTKVKGAYTNVNGSPMPCHDAMPRHVISFHNTATPTPTSTLYVTCHRSRVTCHTPNTPH